MIDLVLQDARVPAGRVDDDRLALVVQGVDADRARPRHDRLVALDAQAAFIEFHNFGAQLETRIGNDVKRNRRSFGRGRFCRVLDYSQLKRQPDLGAASPTPGAWRMVSRISSMSC